MNFSMTIDSATVSTVAKDEYEILQHIQACFMAAGYSADTFAEYLAHFLELYHGMVVMLDKDFNNALDEARNDGYALRDDEDDGAALASAGWGTDEDYGDCERI